VESKDLCTNVVQVLKVPLFAGDIFSAIQEIVLSCGERIKKNRCISATGAHGMVYAEKHKGFHDILKNFYLNLPDGTPGVWVGRLKGAKSMRRCYGPDFFKEMMKASANLPISHFFCGGKPGVAEQLKDSVKKKWGNGHVSGLYCPPFLPVDQYDYESIAKIINESGAHVVWIGLSTPKQEQFAYNLSAFTHVNYIISVGAAFDFHIGKLAQAPPFLQKIGMEWLFRVFMEPKRLFKRYAEIVPFFIYYNLKELFNFGKNCDQT
jgi:N-acetylglucosaminyldiphosphoundecaprenol N-acetyl-beta-D-mannosaminyltransferase